MLRLLVTRLVLHQKPSEVNTLITWCITNPGYKNVYIRKLQSQLFPFLLILLNIRVAFHRHTSKASLRRYASTKAAKSSERNVILVNERYSEVESLINDSDLREKYLKIIRNSSSLTENDATTIYENFLKTIDIVSGFPSQVSIDLLIEMWKFVFERENSSQYMLKLQYKFFNERERFITILMNIRRYSVYQEIVEPLYNKSEFEIHKPTWSDKLINTFQFDIDDKGQLQINRGSIILFLKNTEHSIGTKRSLLAIFLRKGILYSTSLDQKYYIIKEFINLLHEIGDDHLLFIDQDYTVYDKAFRLMAIPSDGVRLSDHLNSIKNIIESSAVENTKSYFNFITTSMRVILGFNPSSVLDYWHVKLNYVEERGFNESEVFHTHDLKSAMSALCLMNMYQSVLDLYQKFPSLHSEEHIEVLLRVSEEFKDWKLLQKQFEDMYGRDQLPYVIHYSIVMNALATIGAKDEVNQLFNQLLRRNLTPTVSIYAALINSEVFYDNETEALRWFDECIKSVENNKINSNSIAYLYSLIFKLYLKSSNLAAAMNFLEDARLKEKNLNIALIDSKSLSEFINFAGTNYGLKELEILRNIGQEMNLTSEEFYENLIRAYTRTDQFQRANDLAYEAHLESDVPFTNANIYKVQLRNYRFWYRNTSHESQSFISERIQFIIDYVAKGNVSLKSNHGLYTEIIKLHLARNDLSSAETMFKVSKNRNMLSEHHFTPFLDYYCKLRTFSGYSQVLELYRQMAKERINISTRTYVYLIKALIHLDSLNHNGYENSFKLLQSVFELNGLSIKPSDEPTKKLPLDILYKSIDLCHIVTSYVMATVGYRNSIDLLVHFLNQMKEKLDGKLTNEFKFYIYKELGRLYLKKGNFLLAKRLIDNGLQETHTIITKFIQDYPYTDVAINDIKVPRRLQFEYRSLLALKFKSMKTNVEAPETYHKLFLEIDQANIVLSGDQYHIIISELLKLSLPEALHTTLYICEEYLVAGNWAEAKLFRKLQYLYKLTMLHISKTMGFTAVQDYAILNRYYNILDIPNLQLSLLHIHDPLDLLKQELIQFNEIHTKAHSKGSFWTLDKVLLNIPAFFSPEVKLSTQNKITPYLCSRIWNEINKYCDEDIQKAFKLMDDFPETIEFLIYNGPARLRLHLFRNEIDQIQLPPASDQREDFESRRLRTLEVLSHLKSPRSSF